MRPKCPRGELLGFPHACPLSTFVPGVQGRDHLCANANGKIVRPKRFFVRADWPPGTTNWTLLEVEEPSKTNIGTVWTLRTPLNPLKFPKPVTGTHNTGVAHPCPVVRAGISTSLTQHAPLNRQTMLMTQDKRQVIGSNPYGACVTIAIKRGRSLPSAMPMRAGSSEVEEVRRGADRALAGGMLAAHGPRLRPGPRPLRPMLDCGPGSDLPTKRCRSLRRCNDEGHNGRALA